MIQADPHSRHELYRFQACARQEPILVPWKNTCGCRLCTDHYGRREQRRRERKDGKKQCRQIPD